MALVCGHPDEHEERITERPDIKLAANNTLTLHQYTKKAENKDMHEQYGFLFLCLVSSQLLICL